MTERKTLARRDPRLRDSIRTDAGAALRDAAGGTKKAAQLLGVSPRWARELVSGRAASIVSHFLELVLHVGDPWKLAELVKFTAYRATMMNDSPQELARKWREGVEEVTQEANAIVSRLVRWQRGVDMKALEHELRALGQHAEMLAVRTSELQRSRIDPRQS